MRGNSSAVDAARMQLPVMTTDQMRRYLVAPQQVEGLAAPPTCHTAFNGDAVRQMNPYDVKAIELNNQQMIGNLLGALWNQQVLTNLHLQASAQGSVEDQAKLLGNPALVNATTLITGVAHTPSNGLQVSGLALSASKGLSDSSLQGGSLSDVRSVVEEIVTGQIRELVTTNSYLTSSESTDYIASALQEELDKRIEAATDSGDSEYVHRASVAHDVNEVMGKGARWEARAVSHWEAACRNIAVFLPPAMEQQQ